MAAPTYDFTGVNELNQGSALTVDFYYLDPDGVTPINLAGYTARMQFRSSASSSVVLLDMNTTNGGLVITPGTGKVSFVLTEALAVAIKWKRAVYDMELVPPSGQAFRFVQGEAEVNGEVTRAG